MCDADLHQLRVHVVLRLHQFSPVHLAFIRFHRDDVALGFMQNFDGNSDRHRVGKMIIRRKSATAVLKKNNW